MDPGAPRPMVSEVYNQRLSGSVPQAGSCGACSIHPSICPREAPGEWHPSVPCRGLSFSRARDLRASGCDDPCWRGPPASARLLHAGALHLRLPATTAWRGGWGGVGGHTAG